MVDLYPKTLWTEVIEKARDVDPGVREAAWFRLVEMYRGPIEAVLRCRLGAFGEPADELVSEFFSEVYLRGLLHQVERKHGRFRAFMQGAARTFALSRWRDHRREKTRRDELPADDAVADPVVSSDVSDEHDSQLWFAELMVETLREIEKGVEGGKAQVRVLALRYGLFALNGASDQEEMPAAIARATGRSSGAVHMAIQRGKSRLRCALEAKAAGSMAPCEPTEFEELFEREKRAMYRALEARYPWILEGRSDG